MPTNVIDHQQYGLIESQDGKIFTFFSDIDHLEQHMLEFAPEDKIVIHDFAKTVRAFGKMDMPVDKAPELCGFFDNVKMVKMLPYLNSMRKWTKVSGSDFTRRFKNPFMREVLDAMLVGDFDIPMMFMLMTFAWLDRKMAGYPVGGAIYLANTIEKRYLDLGGELFKSSRVEKILVENNRAVGIRVAGGQEHRGDVIISAADGHTTIFEMLEGKYMDEQARGYYNNPQLFPPLVYIGLGVARSFEDIAPSVTGLNFPLEEPIKIAGKENRRMGIQIYNFDPTLAPQGKTVLKTQFNTDYDYWKKLRQQPELYRAEKEQIANQVINCLDKRFHGLAAKVEMHDVATPITWERYTGNWRGSYEGWFLRDMGFMTRMKKTLPGLDNFYMAGQWVEPGGGLPTAAMSGRNVSQIICKKDKRPFITAKP